MPGWLVEKIFSTNSVTDTVWFITKNYENFFKNWHILVCKKHFQDKYISFPQIKYKTLSKLDRLQTQSILGKSHILFTLSSGINTEWTFNKCFMSDWMVVTMIYTMNLMRPSSCSFNWTYLFSWHQDTLYLFSAKDPLYPYSIIQSYSLAT